MHDSTVIAVVSVYAADESVRVPTLSLCPDIRGCIKDTRTRHLRPAAVCYPVAWKRTAVSESTAMSIAGCEMC
jgi:hypothetical protein